uniref:GDSL esterase/lipase n=1 Tax=Chenopodium quinoa TaxID=63459 RepID=A0A803MVB9_CHEQI
MTRGAVALLALLLMASSTTTFVRCEPQVPCYFVFGDSLSDPGNNNDLVTKAKANYPPYGIDFPGGVPTGRFSNGRNFVDRITELLGFDEYIPPYSTAKGRQILKGVNYASGAAGIRSETGQHLSLYLLGARKIAVFGLGLVGCTLGEIYTFGTSDGSLCVDKINEAVQLFNEKLITLVDDLTMELPGAQFTYIGASSSTDTGSAVADTTCCKLRDDYQCIEFDTVCEGRDNYIFWDGFHPTEVVNVLSGETAYSGIDSKYIHPKAANGPKQQRPPKSSSKSSSSTQDAIEIEVAEVLYGLMKQSQAPSKQDGGMIIDLAKMGVLRVNCEASKNLLLIGGVATAVDGCVRLCWPELCFGCAIF